MEQNKIEEIFQQLKDSKMELKQWVAKLVVGAAMVDHRIASDEQPYLSALVETLQQEPEVLLIVKQAIQKKSPFSIESQDIPIDIAQQVFEVILEICGSDQELHPREENYIKDSGEALGIDYLEIEYLLNRTGLEVKTTAFQGILDELNNDERYWLGMVILKILFVGHHVHTKDIRYLGDLDVLLKHKPKVLKIIKVNPRKLAVEPLPDVHCNPKLGERIVRYLIGLAVSDGIMDQTAERLIRSIAASFDYKKEELDSLIESVQLINGRLFKNVPKHMMQQLIPLLKLSSYLPGTEILSEGQENDKIFFIIRGIADVYSNGELILQLKRAGDIFGEVSVLTKQCCTASVIAETPVEVVSIQAKNIEQYNDIDAKDLQDTFYRIFSLILTDKLGITTRKARQYEITNRDLQREIEKRKETQEKLELLKVALETYVVELEDGQKQLKAMQAQLIQSAKLASLGEVATGVAHEINQPLSYIKTTIQELQEDFELEDIDTKEAMVSLKESYRQIGRITEIIQHLRTFGRMEETRFVEVNLEKILDNTLLLMGEQMRIKEIRLVRQIEETLPLIKGNPNQLEQVLINLCQNSMDELLKKEKNCCITVKITSSAEEAVVITFSDNGSGIPDEDLEKIFDPFYTTKPIGKGTGLGLSIIYGIIKSHNGKIVCQSQLNQGTSFIITLPIEGDIHGNTKNSNH